MSEKRVNRPAPTEVLENLGTPAPSQDPYFPDPAAPTAEPEVTPTTEQEPEQIGKAPLPEEDQVEVEPIFSAKDRADLPRLEAKMTDGRLEVGKASLVTALMTFDSRFILIVSQVRGEG